MPLSLSGQVVLRGVVTGGDNSSPLKFANVIGEFLNYSKDTSDRSRNELIFSISDVKGNYHLDLEVGSSYIITTSYMGYKSDSLIIKDVKEKREYNISLARLDYALPEFGIMGKRPVWVKGDTIKFDVDFFNKGQETVLGDVLRNLPGINVTDGGAVFMEGERIRKITVEGKPFFSGGTKLGLENIPSDVIAGIDIIDNYNENPVTRDLQSNESKIINVALKEDKKNIVFGNMQAQGGPDRYKAHNNIFRFNPSWSLTVIGDFQNVGVAPLSLQEIIDLNGGINAMIESPEEFFDNQSLFHLIQQNEPRFKELNSKFIAWDINKQGQKTEYKLTGYFNEDENIEENHGITTYVNRANSDLDERFNRTKISTISSAMIHLRVKRYYNKSSLSFNAIMDYSNSGSMDSTLVERTLVGSTSKTNEVTNRFQIRPDLLWARKLSEATAISVGLNGFIKDQEQLSTFKAADKSLFSPLFKVENNEGLQQVRNLEKREFRLFSTIYHRPSSKLKMESHLGILHRSHNASISAFRLSSVNTPAGTRILNLGDNFNLSKNIFEASTKMSYALNKIDIDGTLNLQYLSVSRSGGNNDDLSQVQALPNIAIKYEDSNNRSISVKYLRRRVYIPTYMFSSNNSIQTFNSVISGLTNLILPTNNELSLSFSRLSLMSPINYNIRLQYSHGEKLFHNYDIDGYNIIRTSSINDQRTRSINLSLEHSTGWGAVNINGTYDNSSVILFSNNQEVESFSQNVSVVLASDVYMTDEFTGKLGLSAKRRGNTIGETKNGLSTIEGKFKLKYFRDKVRVNVETEVEVYINNNRENLVRSLLDLELEYKLKDKPIYLGIIGRNLLNSNTLNSIRVEDIIVSESIVSLLPRVVMVTANLRF